MVDSEKRCGIIYSNLFPLFCKYEKRQAVLYDQKDLFRLHADFCKFMTNPKRIEILYLIGEKEMCVEEIAKAIGVNVPNISQHLAIMREKGVLK